EMGLSLKDSSPGFDPLSATVLGALPGPVATRGRVDVTAIVATWPGSQPLSVVDLAEVASVHRIPVHTLADQATRFTAHLPVGYSGPGFDVNGQFVWGMTAHVLDRLLRLAGWEQRWDTGRRRRVPRDVGGW
ncbi:MAG: CoA pyrophosphatase, partial [Ruaniaceae bacterium]|nr:CoA pyrophosphatase [Ruaniaceae bacterium]